MTFEEAQRRAYWLGQLADADRDALEESYFSSAEAFTLLRAAEQDLLDDYASHALNAADREAFETFYLVTAERRRQLSLARALTHPPAGRKLPAWSFALTALAASVAIMLLLTPPTPTPPAAITSAPTVPASASPKTQPPTATPQAPVLPLLALARDTDRGDGDGNRLTLPRNATAFRLTAPSAAAGPHRVDFVTPEGLTRWTGKGITAQRAAGYLVSCEVPAARVPDGAYIVRLTRAAGQVEEFAAEILRAPLR